VSKNPWRTAVIVLALLIVLGGRMGSQFLSGLGDSGRSVICTPTATTRR